MDRRGKGDKRRDKWRPTISMCQQDDLLIDRLELLFDNHSQSLANQVTEECTSWFGTAIQSTDYHLLTLGRLCDPVILSSSILVFNVTDFIGAPLSACSTSGFLKHCSRITVRWSSWASCVTTLFSLLERRRS
jgi:Regulator of RNA terminal phosphate cyclase